MGVGTLAAGKIRFAKSEETPFSVVNGFLQSGFAHSENMSSLPFKVERHSTNLPVARTWISTATSPLAFCLSMRSIVALSQRLSSGSNSS